MLRIGAARAGNCRQPPATICLDSYSPHGLKRRHHLFIQLCSSPNSSVNADKHLLLSTGQSTGIATWVRPHLDTVRRFLCSQQHPASTALAPLEFWGSVPSEITCKAYPEHPGERARRFAQRIPTTPPVACAGQAFRRMMLSEPS